MNRNLTRSITQGLSQTSIHAFETEDTRPSPADIIAFLPWAVKELDPKSEVFIKYVVQDKFVSQIQQITGEKKKGKKGKGMSVINIKSEQTIQPPAKNKNTDDESEIPDYVTIISAIFEEETLVQLKFEKNKQLPRMIFSVMRLIIEFYPRLYSISIRSGLNELCVHEICKFIPLSNITDICFDDTYLGNPNYHILLNQPHQLRHLSLARCKLDDENLEKIASKLVFPVPGSKKLALLNLSTNMITDVGAKILADVLRSNRKLSYLNLSGNKLTDIGVGFLCDVLLNFPLTYEETLAAKARYVNFLKFKAEAVENALKNVEELKKFSKKVFSRPKKGKTDDGEDPVYKIALQFVQNSIGDFDDPFSSTNTFTSLGVLWCKGNNTLAYLNIGYNNSVTEITLRKIIKVLNHQKQMERSPRGIVNLNVEGNFLPEPGFCLALTNIDFTLENYIQTFISGTRKAK